MEEFFLGVLFGGLLIGRAGKAGAPGGWLRAFLNRKRYQRFYDKSLTQGFEREFQEQWLIHSNDTPYQYQTGMESMRAFRQAQAMFKASKR